MNKIPRSILIANHHLEHLGGSETYTYALAEELTKQQFDVDYFTFHKGTVSDKLETDLGVRFRQKKKYDLILANHYTCVNQLRSSGFIIQTCHGIYPELEQPSPHANGYVAISQEVQDHLAQRDLESKVILNGINMDRYKSTNPLHSEVRTVLSMCQSDEANQIIEASCKAAGVRLITLNKFKNPEWNVEKAINRADLVVAIGRSAYEAMACGRPVIIFDHRSYFQSCGDGYVRDRLERSLLKNCSGRYSNKTFSVAEVTKEIKKFRPEDGTFFRNFALKKLNIAHTAQEYLDYFQHLRYQRSGIPQLSAAIKRFFSRRSLKKQPYIK
ncbi:glycosyltransferase [Niabella beijingensis]|uniref:glycosyltransferase n=1 Tax=Niabella beijingensis TaxID=2872700 RepID=UPI001CC0424B|nr:UDP-glycosyltransferase [Niabella beijingensis]MBZ4190432.1 UDP-glycosyltransferase [Niabella beijingensis]